MPFETKIVPYNGERVVYSTAKPFDEVVASARSSVARLPPNVGDILYGGDASKITSAFEDAAKTAERPSGFFLFLELNHGAWYKAYDAHAQQAHKLVIGSPLALRHLLAHDPAAGLHAPWNFLILEHGVETQIVFDLPVATLRSAQGGDALDQESLKLQDKFKALVESWL